MDILAEKKRLQELRQQYHVASETETQKQLAARNEEIKSLMAAIEEEILRGCVRPVNRQLSGQAQVRIVGAIAVPSSFSANPQFSHLQSSPGYEVLAFEIGCSAVGDETKETRPFVKATSRDEAVAKWNELAKNWKGAPL